MRKMHAATLALAASALLVGCSGKAPTGQVVAKVGKEEITVQELQAELKGFNAPDAKTRKLAEQRALQAIIERKLVARAAVAAGVAKSPEYAIQKARVEDGLLVDTWQKSLIAAVPDPGPDQVKDYIAKHPELFANHKVYAVDQVRLPQVNDPALLAALKPLTTLDSIVELLKARGIRYEVGKGSLDSLAFGPQGAAQLEKLPPNEIFILPIGNALVANQTTSVQVTPVPDAIATKLATQLIKNDQARTSVTRMFSSVVANHPKVKVVYNKAYEPPPAPAGAGKTNGKAG